MSSNNWKCGNCGIVYNENPDSCEDCGSTVLRHTDEEATRFLDGSDGVTEVEGVDEDVLLGKNIEEGSSEVGCTLIMEGGYELEVNDSREEVVDWLERSYDHDELNIYEFESDEGTIYLRNEKIHGVKDSE